jgi:putative endonuclease
LLEYTEGIYNFYVYIITNKNKKVLYTGVTNNLKRRLGEHKNKLNPNSFAGRYNVEFYCTMNILAGYNLQLQGKKK